MTKFYLNSLRGRYIVLASLLAIFIVVGAIWAYINVTEVTKENQITLDNRNRMLDRSREIWVAVFESFKSLEAFLLDPHRAKHRIKISENLNQSILYVDNLSKEPWILENEQLARVESLKSSLLEFSSAVVNLIQTRIDVAQQYPSLSLSNRVMRPARNNVQNSISLALREIDADEDTPHNVYKEFIKARYLWIQMLSNYRLYLANRVGSFNELVLPTQEKSIDTLFEALNAQFSVLNKLKDQQKLGFESSAALEDFIENAEQWYQGFVEVKRIHASEEWRADAKLIKETIEPRLEEISEILKVLDNAIEGHADRQLAALTGVTKSQTQMLWLVIGFAILFISASYIALERLVLRPMLTVANALKAEAVGKEGFPLPEVDTKETQNLVDAFSEMRKQVHSRQVALEYQALHDSLTGLANRALLSDRIEQAIHGADREKNELALLIMDIDNFKEVNDTLGHLVGDLLLKEVGARLLQTLRHVDTVSRMGGDEFAIMIPETNEHQAKVITTKIVKALEDEFILNELHLYVKASIGIAVYPHHGRDSLTLIQHADVAMYVAKKNKLGYSVYDPEQDTHSIGRLALINDLRRAIELEQLHVHYQPKLAVQSRNILGVEALLRWNHPIHGPISPDRIIPLAEQTGLIKPLTFWVMDAALKDCKKWVQQGIELNVAVNLSMYNLKDFDVVDQVTKFLSRYHLEPQCLTLEITESAMMSNLANAVEILDKFDNMGINLAIDDFGTGFSSLAYLKQLPLDELKIDKSFVMDMTKDDNDLQIVHSTIELAHNLGLKVVAEGVEDKEALNILADMQCDAAQGYYLSHPLAPDELEEWLVEQKKVAPH